MVYFLIYAISKLLKDMFRNFLRQVLRTGGQFQRSVLCNTKHHQKSIYFKNQNNRAIIRKFRITLCFKHIKYFNYWFWLASHKNYHWISLGLAVFKYLKLIAFGTLHYWGIKYSVCNSNDFSWRTLQYKPNKDLFKNVAAHSYYL